MASTDILRFDDGIAAIDTGYVRPLMDASHLIVEAGRAAFVDTGVNDSVPRLLAALDALSLDPGDVDFVFLTHVHLDHAGGAGLLMQALPNAMCVVHPRGARHMADPSKLRKGTEAVYGVERAQEMYGTLEPIAPARIVEAGDEQRFELNGRPLETLHTEGHARHHYVIDDPRSKSVFTGDSFGISYRELDTPAGPFVFVTATPIDFDPDAAHVAYDRIMARRPRQVFLTHYSRVGDVERLGADLHAEVEAYRRMALAAENEADRVQALEARLFDHYVARLAAHGYSGGNDEIRRLLGIDIGLNALGLSVWLDRRRKAA